MPEGYGFEHSDEEVERQLKHLLKSLEHIGETSKKRTFINCWHENEHESEAMWRLYSSFLDNAIAIRTSYNSLYHALGRNPSIRIGRVKYVDFQQSYAGLHDAFWCKRKSFEHEKEVRAMLIDRCNPDKGKLVPCDLPILIKEVFVSPSAQVGLHNLLMIFAMKSME